jgi:CheY-like chemotaxis protein
LLKAAERAKALVQQILSFSRQEEKQKYPTQIHLLVKEALKLLRASIPTTIDIREDVDPHCGSVLADPSQIHQVLMNLCTNASHAMRGSDGVLGIKLDCAEVGRRSATGPEDLAEGQYVRLTVSDTGPGMDSVTKERIFEPYFTTKSVGEGSGLGLSVVHGIVSGYGGAITVESRPGEGTTFAVYFPRFSRPSTPLPAKPASNPPQGRETVLFVDDEPSNAAAGEMMLTELGYQVTAVTSSLEALATFRLDSGGFDIVVTDQTLPQMTGAELAKEMLSIRSDLPIIICTGYSDVLDEARAKRIGAKALLMKPLNLQVLAESLRSALDSG